MARQVADQTAYAGSYRDPVRAINPYTPTELVTGGQAPHVPIVGIAVLAGAVLLFEHLRRKKGR
jgi:hypothetical protein